MDKKLQDSIYGLVLAGTTVLASMLMRKLLEKGWKSVRKKEPPKNPESSEVDWSEAIAWTVATGVTVGMGRLMARRLAAAGWKALTGREAPEES